MKMVTSVSSNSKSVITASKSYQPAKKRRFQRRHSQTAEMMQAACFLRSVVETESSFLTTSSCSSSSCYNAADDTIGRIRSIRSSAKFFGLPNAAISTPLTSTRNLNPIPSEESLTGVNHGTSSTIFAPGTCTYPPLPVKSGFQHASIHRSQLSSTKGESEESTCGESEDYSTTDSLGKSEGGDTLPGACFTANLINSLSEEHESA